MKKLLLACILCITLTGCSLFPIPASNKEIYQEAMDTIPNFENTYYLSKLTGNDLAFVVNAYKGLMKFENKIEMNLKFKDSQHLDYLIELLQYDCPEIFQFSTNGASTVLYHYLKGTNVLTDIEFSYLMDQSDYEEVLPLVKKEIQNIVLQAQAYSNDPFEQEFYVYEYITNTCLYDDSVKHYSDVYGVLIEKKSACLGFARTMEWILNELNIPTLVVAGHGNDQTLGHAWNIIYLNKEYYCLDVTADVCTEKETTYKTYRYFNVPDTYFNDTYAIQDAVNYIGIPSCKEQDMNFYTHNDAYIYDTDDISYTFISYLSEYLNKSGTYLLKIESQENYNYIQDHLQELYEKASEQDGNPPITISYAHLDEDRILYFIIER